MDAVALILVLMVTLFVGHITAIALAVRYFPHPSSETPVVARSDSNAAVAPAVGIEVDAREEKRMKQRVRYKYFCFAFGLHDTFANFSRVPKGTHEIVHKRRG